MIQIRRATSQKTQKIAYYQRKPASVTARKNLLEMEHIAKVGHNIIVKLYAIRGKDFADIQ